MPENELIEIDCAQGEGGGQIVRTSLALAVLLQKPVHLFNIRAGRPKPGLQAQHLTALKALGEISSAEIRGAELHSKEVFFSPKTIVSQKLIVHIGTAGSISLLLHQLLPVALKADLEFHVFGGTDVSFAPSIAFLQWVLFPKLKAMNCRFDIQLLARGFFPKGNGRVFFKSKKTRLPLKPFSCLVSGNFLHFKCFSSSSGLPVEVAKNQLIAAKKILLEKFPEADLEEKSESNPTRKDMIGTSLDLLAFFENSCLGANALGEKAKPAEKVGKEAAEKLLWELETGMPIDSHCADQLLVFMALAKGKSEISVSKFTGHCRTNIEIIEKFLPCKFSVQGSLGKPAIICVEGIAFK